MKHSSLFLLFLSIATVISAQSQQSTIPEEARREGITREELPAWQALRAAGTFAPASANAPQHAIVVDFTKLDLTPVDTCANRDAEQNDFSTWKLLEGTFSGSNTVTLNTPATSPPPSTTARFALTPIPNWQSPVGFDPTVGTRTPQVPVVLDGTHSFRLGNAVNGKGAEAMYQTFIVTPANASFVVKYAVVLQNPPQHPADIQPFAGIFFYDVSNPNAPQLITFMERVADSSDSFFHSCDHFPPNDPRYCGGQSQFVWREVSCFRADLTPAMGHPVMAMYVTADCGAGAHYGYAYFDGTCGPPPAPTLNVSTAGFCPSGGQPVTATASSTVGVVSHGWTIVETDSNGANPVGSTLVTQNVIGPIVSPQNLSSLYAAQGKKFECGKYYRVTLNLTTECGTNSASKIIFINCPPEPVIAGPPDVCGDGTYCVKPQHGIIHTWTVQGGAPSSATGNCIKITWGSTGPYSITVTATNPAGCKVSKTISVLPCNCCKDTRLTTGRPSLTGGAGGLYMLSEPLTLIGFGPVTQVSAAVISASITPSAPGCGTSGNVAATIPSGSAVNPFNGPLLNAIPGTEIAWTSGTAVNINGQSFPFQIQLPAPPPAPCADVLKFCVRYTFTGFCGAGQTGCRSCSFVVCHRVIRSCDSIIWPDSLITSLTSQLQQEID
jgi:hypothetical protein